MKKYFLLLLVPMMMFSACGEQKAENPFLSDYTTPFGVPPFDQIKNEHFVPAMEEAMLQHNAEIDAIVSNPEAPTFENTIAALDYSGHSLNKIAFVFYNFNSSNTSPEIEAIASELAPKLSAHGDNISLNPELFKRIQAVYEQKENLNLTGEQARLLEQTYKSFVRNGAALPEENQERFREINQRLALLTLEFGQNALGEVNNYKMVVENEADLAGLPRSVIDAAAETAAAQGLEGQWVFTLQNPSVMPFLAYAENRELRQQLQQAYVNRGNNGNEFDNNAIIGEIVNLRLERAQLLGYSSHAEFVLEENMAKTVGTVTSFLEELWGYALPIAKEEAAMMQELIDARGGDYKLAAWDWRYYAEQVRKEKYDLNEEEIRQYFELNTVRDGVFMVVNKLYGLQFVERTDIPKYHPEAVAYEVLEADGSHRGILYMDFHPRESKRGGAWMSSYRDQYVDRAGNYVHPVITLVTNFSRPTASQPALLTYDEMTTFFHEFGHALHGLLSDVTYPGLSGTNVARDFVELPSQIMENWAKDPAVMKDFALHHETREPMPQELMDKLVASGHFNQGFETVEFLASTLLDMEYHTITEPYAADQLDQVARITNERTINKYTMMPEIYFRHGSTHFQHIFSGGYSSGYYSYIWSGILDADAYEAFREAGDLFDPATALAFRKNVLERGGTEDPMALYVKFRGHEPEVEPLLRQRGLLR
ncbi:MAG: M3 family metallopeptidase [Bacteroidales bacterium]|jgi:peptidyl-dipeptidase Dcp|nr:M3 family metallopeptidase [Bacteroidales bacterium]